MKNDVVLFEHYIPIPMHTKTFQQGVEPFNEPIDWMKRIAPNYKIQIGLNEIGQTFVLS